ncbi:hypothetical protein [Streptomyces sp. NPDC006971]|uniref:hypothetical protein n=1 Tax=Streptomyces sp. NPDC006971 TaxID=3154784 RepID=UPI0033D06B32
MPSTTVVATYHGQQIDLGSGWGGAAICTEVAANDVRCYDNETEEMQDLADESLGHAVAASEQGLVVPGALDTSKTSAHSLNGTIGTKSIAECTYGYACLYDTTTYSGRILRWSATGKKNLSDWTFRDMAGSGCNNRVNGGARIDDWRTGMPDPSLYMAVGGCYDFASVDYVYGGNWNNKADAITL